MKSAFTINLFIVATVPAFMLGCAKAPAPMAMPTPQVTFVTAHAEQVPLIRDLVGRLSATRQADVRARVAGVLLKRVYTEGADVKQGQTLFLIDPNPLKAALDAQLANLASAEASAANAKVLAKRATELAPEHYISQNDLDNARANDRTAAASVQQFRANVELARINLGYANVTAPIAGRAGQQQVTEGALVGQGEATLLTTVEQIDPIYVNFSQAVGDLDRLKRAQASGSVKLVDQNKAQVDITLPDGTHYAKSGMLDFSDAAVDSATGAVALRAIVPNPDHALLPGMFVNVRVTSGAQTAYRIPTTAVQSDDTGFFVLTVDADNKAVVKHLTTDRLDGDVWIATGGVADGDRVIVSGLQQARPGSPVQATPWQAPAAAKAEAPAGPAQ
ncbi:MAG TPA: efflux RND transporter periplasmic adaptor subunit [Steroidobacteraceae bacterium]